MNPSKLFGQGIEEELAAWIAKFPDLDSLFENRSELYEKLNTQNIQGIIEDGAIVEGDVHIGQGSIIRSCAVIRGPVIIGENTIIDSHTLIKNGVFIGSKSIISSHVCIDSSVCFNGVIVKTGACLENMMLGSQSSVGENSILGAVKTRQPETNVSTMIGDNALLAPNTIIKQGSIIEANYSSEIK